MQSIHYLKKISDPVKRIPSPKPIAFWKGISLPFQDTNFRRFIIFSCAWSFSVYFSGPFFTLYFLRELRFSYAFVALLGTVAALTDLLGMHLWGRISDRVKNKAVIRVASWVAIFLPLAWATVQPESVIMPIILHIVAGGFWAGINLCMNNLLFGITPKENKSFFLSVYNIAVGSGAAAAPVLAGLILKHLDGLSFQIASFQIIPLQIIFVTSTVLRLLSSRLLLKTIKEPEEVEPIQLIRIIRNVRALNIASGFNHLLHPFVEIFKETTSDSENRRSKPPHA
jgi:MFS-type transporter involved in bile tolerance (Atg22 family)